VNGGGIPRRFYDVLRLMDCEHHPGQTALAQRFARTFGSLGALIKPTFVAVLVLPVFPCSYRLLYGPSPPQSAARFLVLVTFPYPFIMKEGAYED